MKPRVLVVEDQIAVMEQICDFLEWIGLDVVGKAKNGKEAVDLYERANPDLVTMDLKMPLMDGAEATREIIANDDGARILVFTSLDIDGTTPDENGLLDKALGAGAIGAVSKFSKAGIAKKLEELFPGEVDL